MPIRGFRGLKRVSRSQQVDGQPDDAHLVSSSRQRTVIDGRALALIVLLLGVIALVAFGLWEQLPQDLIVQWPILLVIAGALLLLFRAVTARRSGVLIGPLVGAVGIIFLLNQQGTDVSPMLLAGYLLVATGLGIVVRGLTLERV